MNLRLICCFVILIGLFNCDGRYRKKDSLDEAVKELKNKNLTDKQLSIFPKNYTEVETDTLINNAFNVKIKKFALMDGDLLIGKSNNKKDRQFYRKFQSDIIISHNNNELLNLAIKADTFELRDDSSFWVNATLQHTWVDLEQSTSTEVLILCSFLNPETEQNKLYGLKVDHNGKYSLRLIEEII